MRSFPFPFRGPPYGSRGQGDGQSVTPCLSSAPDRLLVVLIPRWWSWRIAHRHSSPLLGPFVAVRNLERERFQVTEIQCRKAEMSARADVIRNEMAEAVKSLGGAGKADAAIFAASRVIGLPASLVARLRWKKIKRVPADVADAVREARDRAAAEAARNELSELDARIARIEALFLPDEEFGRPHLDALRSMARRQDRSVDGAAG